MTAAQQVSSPNMVTAQNTPTYDVTITDRVVSFVVYCAPLDDAHNIPFANVFGNTDVAHRAVTDSASYLSTLPYVVIDADTEKVLFPVQAATGGTQSFPARVALENNALHDGKRWKHSLPAIHIPDETRRIALHIANDAYADHRNFKLFSWSVPDAAHSKVHIYEVRADVKSEFARLNTLGQVPADNSLVEKPNVQNQYFGFLDGDLWLRISHEFTTADIRRLCPPGTISRTCLTSAAASQSGVASGTPGGLGAPDEQLHVDWSVALAPIYAAGQDSRSMNAFSVIVSQLGITVHFAARAFANAINSSARTTIQQALSRTSPRAFAAVLRAAWRLHIDTLDLSSSWRPMLGSSLHKMGIGIDVTRFDDDAESIQVAIRNQGAQDRNQPFPSTVGGRKLGALYEELTHDTQVAATQVFTPWVHWVEPHDTHMHVTAAR
ncbi:hypothetical protein ACW9YQ_04725 [Paraburkholderia strydomiana]|uniref:hypothetical protein n=1 Tax=Paraburkholderia strydomiana TaxID=1245417 RepID=UPI00195B0969|nr:hypothetical protein [Paraburkholderia strydomiana]MDR7009771.1 hypothetical protein [Paraburkholderia strydomiana]